MCFSLVASGRYAEGEQSRVCGLDVVEPMDWGTSRIRCFRCRERVVDLHQLALLTADAGDVRGGLELLEEAVNGSQEPLMASVHHPRARLTISPPSPPPERSGPPSGAGVQQHGEPEPPGWLTFPGCRGLCNGGRNGAAEFPSKVSSLSPLPLFLHLSRSTYCTPVCRSFSLPLPCLFPPPKFCVDYSASNGDRYNLGVTLEDSGLLDDALAHYEVRHTSPGGVPRPLKPEAPCSCRKP